MSNMKKETPQDNFYKAFSSFSSDAEKTAGSISKEVAIEKMASKGTEKVMQLADELGVLAKEAMEQAGTLEQTILKTEAPAPVAKEEIEAAQAMATPQPSEVIYKGEVAPSIDAVVVEEEVTPEEKLMADAAKVQAEVAVTPPVPGEPAVTDEQVKDAIVAKVDAEATLMPSENEANAAAVAAATDGEVMQEESYPEDGEEEVTATELVRTMLKAGAEQEAEEEILASDLVYTILKEAAELEEAQLEKSAAAEDMSKEEPDDKEDEEEENGEEEAVDEEEEDKEAAKATGGVEKTASETTADIANRIYGEMTKEAADDEMIKEAALSVGMAVSDELMTRMCGDVQAYTEALLKAAGVEDEEELEKVSEIIVVEAEKFAKDNGSSAYLAAADIIDDLIEKAGQEAEQE